MPIVMPELMYVLLWKKNRGYMIKTIYLTVKLDIETDDESDMDYIVQEMDYDFKSTVPDGKVVDTEIIHFESKEDFEERN